MIPNAKLGRAGNTTIEFLFVGIPVLFLIISVFEIARGMWIYQTLAHATHSVTRHISVRGTGCGTPNSCTQTLSSFARDFASVANGMDPSLMVVTFYSQASSIVCNPLSSCYSNSTTWPPVADGTPGNDVRIGASCPFPNALGMFWPGSSSVPFATISFYAFSRQRILF